MVLAGSPPAAGGRLSSWVYEQVKARLLSGEFQGGQALSVENLRADFGVSKQPVMEALRLLAADGLVAITPQVGSAVARYSVQDALDFYRIFARFEGVVAEVAATRSTPAGLERLRAAAKGMHLLEASDDPTLRARSYMTGNREFHGLIHEMADSPIMVMTSRRLWDLSDFLIVTAGPRNLMSGALSERNHEHDEILDALAAKDTDRARTVMEEHILEVADLLRPLAGQERSA